MKVTLSTHRTDDDALLGRNPVDVLNGRDLAEIKRLIAAELRRGPGTPCPYSGYQRPDPQALFVRIEVPVFPSWPIIMRMADVERRASLALVPY